MDAIYKIVPVTDFSGYFIDTEGVVWSNKGDKYNMIINSRIKRLKRVLHHSGYLLVCLHKNKKRHTIFVHRLVLEALVGPCPEGMECRHLNGDRADENLENLRWGTSKENKADKILHKTDNRGEKHYKTKLTDKDALEIYRLKGIETCKSIAKRFNISIWIIYNIWNKRRWKHIHK